MALYVGTSNLSADDPRVSPLFAPSLRDVAPALVITSDLDPLEDDGVRYVERLRQARVPAHHISYTDVPHGFLWIPG